MKKIIILILAALFLNFILISQISSAPPFISTTQTGSLEIIAPTYDYITQNKDMDFYWHVFNTSSLLTNKTTTCAYHLYSKNLKSEHIYTNNNVKGYANDRDFEVEIKGANFSTLGDYCHLIECNTTTQAGGLERCFIVTSNGEQVSLSNTILIIAFLIISVIFFIIGYSFRMENYLVKSSFYLLALFMALLSVNSARIIAGESANLSKMSLTGLVVMISVICFMFLYVFITWTINTFRQLKDKREVRWQY